MILTAVAWLQPHSVLGSISAMFVLKRYICNFHVVCSGCRIECVFLVYFADVIYISCILQHVCLQSFAVYIIISFVKCYNQTKVL